MLAELARTDVHNHRPVAGDSDLAEAVKVLARAHQSMIWTRRRQTNQLCSTLREFYPGALTCFDDLDGGDALAVLAVAPTPVLGRGLSRSKIAGALRRGGRQRRVEERAMEIQAALRADQLAAPDVVSQAMGTTVAALVAVIAKLNAQIATLEESLVDRFEKHPAAKIIRSLPGLGMILGARAAVRQIAQTLPQLLQRERMKFVLPEPHLAVGSSHPSSVSPPIGPSMVHQAPGSTGILRAVTCRDRESFPVT